MTYNVHSCVGTDRKLSPERIAEVISTFQPDIVALQEVDVARRRSGYADQAQIIAGFVQMQSHFHAAIRLEEESYGDAILSRWPMTLQRAALLPAVPRQIIDERRGALWVEITPPGQQPIHVLNTHLGLGRNERRTQALALLGHEWLGSALLRGPTILCGDFNSLPNRRVHRLLSGALRDVQRAAHGRHRATFPSRYPLICLDHIFVSESIRVQSATIPRTPLTRVASDHLPLLTELEVSPAP